MTEMSHQHGNVVGFRLPDFSSCPSDDLRTLLKQGWVLVALIRFRYDCGAIHVSNYTLGTVQSSVHIWICNYNVSIQHNFIYVIRQISDMFSQSGPVFFVAIACDKLHVCLACLQFLWTGCTSALSSVSSYIFDVRFVLNFLIFMEQDYLSVLFCVLWDGLQVPDLCVAGSSDRSSWQHGVMVCSGGTAGEGWVSVSGGAGTVCREHCLLPVLSTAGMPGWELFSINKHWALRWMYVNIRGSWQLC